ncbi:tryptophan 7-halogenase [Ferrimonas gelatinilytica]
MMRECQATYKNGILFRQWRKPVAGEPHEYFHPFEEKMPPGASDPVTPWLAGGQGQRYDQTVSLGSLLSAHQHGPKGINAPAWQGLVPYGYHLDAVLLGRYLKRKAVAAGVEHRLATIEKVSIEGGEIRALHCQDGTLEADLYIDCSGFSQALIGPLKADNWQSFEAALPCNRAVALQLPYQDGQAPRPYTTATALGEGWVWEIDLQGRRGNGYVYDGNRLTEAEAEAQLRTFLGCGDQGDAKHLKMKIGCLREFWVGNCVAVGLSGGFIEPLESTGLHLINLSVRLLATHLNQARPAQAVRDNYNRLLNGIYDDLKRFIILHYCLTDRDDTEFWRQAAQSHRHSPVLSAQLTLWQHKVCEYLDLAGSYSTVFSDENYRYVLYGMDHRPKLPTASEADAQQARNRLQRLNQLLEQALAQSAPHRDQLPG